MKAHLPALLALVSATSYVACGSSDGSRTDQEAGASGEGGDANNSGGSENAAGTSSTAGSGNSSGGGGDTGRAGAPAAVGGEGGMIGAVVGGAGGSAGEEPVGGEAGSAGAPTDSALPAACPGVLGDYTLLDGGLGADTFTGEQLNGKVLARGLEGDDLFQTNAGQDCLVGGPGDDDFTSASEGASYFVGGPGADVFHLAAAANNYTHIADMTAEDTIGLSMATFYFLAGTPGGPPYASQVYSIEGYEAGTGLVPSAEGAAIVYDPATGGLWQDTNRGSIVSGATQIATIVNAAGYTYELDDFVLDD